MIVAAEPGLAAGHVSPDHGRRRGPFSTQNRGPVSVKIDSLVDGKPVDAPPVKPPNALTLTTEPQANVERYDALRKARETRHAS